MKISPAKATSVINNLENNIKFILLYGQNYGQIQILKDKVINKIFSKEINKNIINFDSTLLKEHPSELENEIYSSSLFSDTNKKLIIIKDSKDFLNKIINKSITTANFPDDTIILSLSEELPSSSTLRKFAEQNEASLSIACYFNTLEDNISLINSTLKNNNILINSEIIKYLATNLSQDSLIALNTIEKLILYVYPKNEITKTDIDSAIIDQNIVMLDTFINALFNKNKVLSYNLLIKLLEEENPITILKIIQNNLLRLLIVKSALDKNISREEALKLLQPPVFFSNVNSFNQQLNNYTTLQLTNILNKSHQLENYLKLYSNFNDIILKNYILQFSI
jgi:DNA polymerase-3 subunit delta